MALLPLHAAHPANNLPPHVQLVAVDEDDGEPAAGDDQGKDKEHEDAGAQEPQVGVHKGASGRLDLQRVRRVGGCGHVLHSTHLRQQLNARSVPPAAEGSPTTPPTPRPPRRTMIEKSALRKVPMSSFCQPNSCSAVMAQRGYSSVTSQNAFFQDRSLRPSSQPTAPPAEAPAARRAPPGSSRRSASSAP